MNRLALLLVASVSLAPGQAPSTASAEAGSKASIEGVVINESTQAPLRRAEISLERSRKGEAFVGGAGNAAYSAVTDAAGKFRIENIEPGEYLLNPHKTGFLAGGHEFSFSSRTIKLSAGDALTGLRYALLPQAILSGRVVDDEGEPVQGVSVQLVQFRYTNGSLRPMPSGQTQTNDRGEYRLNYVPPGKYYIQANVQQMGMGNGPVAGGAAPGALSMAFISTYFPSAAEIAQATLVVVQAGQEISGQDIALRKEKVFTVSGRVLSPDGAPAKRAYVMFAPGDGYSGYGGLGAPIDEKGNFVARTIPPGRYTLVVNASDGRTRQAGQATINVEDADVSHLTLQLAPGVDAKGIVVVESTAKKNLDLSKFAVQAHPADQGPFGGAGSQVKADGSFTLSQIMPGQYLVTVYTGSMEGYVSSVLVGGEEVYGKEVDAASLALGGVRVVLRFDAANAKGTVEIPEERKSALRTPVAVLLPVEARLRKAGLAKFSQIEQSGSFEFKNIRPGKYLAFAFEELDYNSISDPEVFAAIEDKGEKVSLAADESKTLTLKMLPWPQELADRLP